MLQRNDNTVLTSDAFGAHGQPRSQLRLNSSSGKNGVCDFNHQCACDHNTAAKLCMQLSSGMTDKKPQFTAQKEWHSRCDVDGKQILQRINLKKTVGFRTVIAGQKRHKLKHVVIGFCCHHHWQQMTDEQDHNFHVPSPWLRLHEFFAWSGTKNVGDEFHDTNVQPDIVGLHCCKKCGVHAWMMFFFAGVATALIHFSKEIQQCIHHVGSCSSIFPMVGIHDQFIQVTHKWMLTIKQLCCPWLSKQHQPKFAWSNHTDTDMQRQPDAEMHRHADTNSEMQARTMEGSTKKMILDLSFCDTSQTCKKLLKVANLFMWMSLWKLHAVDSQEWANRATMTFKDSRSGCFRDKLVCA